MKQINIYSFHKGIAEHRFDHNNTISIYNELCKQGYKVNHYEYVGNGEFIYNNIPINHGSILIFEFENGTFKTFDFGDHPSLTVELSKNKNFDGAIIGQYNPIYWDSIISNIELRKKIISGIYPETVWQLGVANYDLIQNFRNSIQLDKRLYWRGSLYNTGVDVRYLGVRKAIELLPTYLDSSELAFGAGAISFESYIQEAINFQLVLSIGGGGGAVCGDFCLRDIEMFGLGIPLIRPKYITETSDPLIPNYHYIAVDAELDDNFRYKNHNELSMNIVKKYKDVINDIEFLDFIKNNAKQWYDNNISYPNITYKLLNLLEL